jgi:hypothetical protein
MHDKVVLLVFERVPVPLIICMDIRMISLSKIPACARRVSAAIQKSQGPELGVEKDEQET